MGLQVVGAGLPRTGTLSLKGALERLLGGRCYHMSELVQHPHHAAVWADAADGRPPDWETFLAGCTAAVDWPAARLWKQLSAAFPQALVLLSVRDSAEQWWHSLDRTIFARIREARPSTGSDGDGPPVPMFAMTNPQEQAAMQRMFRQIATDGFADAIDDKDAAVTVYERHLAEVRAAVPSDRLLEWRPGDGWDPLCAALRLPVPDEPFPHVNRSEDFHPEDWIRRPQ